MTPSSCETATFIEVASVFGLTSDLLRWMLSRQGSVTHGD